MPNWSGGILTTKGQALQAKVDAGGVTLTLTKMKIGSGVLPIGQSIQNMNDLVEPQMDVPISGVTASGNITTITGVITNSGLTNGFNVRELGIFAQDPTLGEILYSITIDSAPDYLPPEGGSTAVSEEFSFNIVVSNSANVTAVLNQNGLVTVSILEQHTNDKNNPHQVMAAQVHHAAISGLTGTDLQSSLAAIFSEAKKKGTVGRNMILTGPKDASGNPVALYSDLTSGTISLKAGTKLTFANGQDDVGLPVDIPYNVMADVTKVLTAADLNTIPLRYTADLCTGGTAISGGDASSYPIANLFDNNTSTYWTSSRSTANQLGNDYVGYDFVTTKQIRMIKITQNTASPNTTMTSVKVQYSNNGTTWSDACTQTIPAGVATITVPAGIAARYWRLLANANLTNGYSWNAFEIEMHEALQTHYLYADYANSSVNLIASKNAPKKAQQNNVVFIDGHYSSDLCTAGTALSGGDASGSPASSAFDNSTGTAWGSSQTNGWAGVSYIGYDFGAENEKMIRRIHLIQGETNYVSSVKIQGTNTLGSWIDIATVTLTSKDNVVDIPSSLKYRYWRLLANSALATAPPASWYISEIEMMEYIDPVTITTDDSILYSDNLCVCGGAISGGDLYAKERAFDGNKDVAWSSSQTALNQLGNAWIGYNFGASRSIKMVTILQGDSTHNQNISSVKIQRSTDAVIWSDVGTYAIGPNLNILTLPATTAAQFWRVLANSNTSVTGYPWDVYEIAMYELSTDVNVYDQETGKSRHYDGTSWTDVNRIYLGSADVDSTGKIAAVTCEPYNLARIQVRDAESSNAPIALGQLLASLTANGWAKIPAIDPITKQKIDFILQWGSYAGAAGTYTVTFPLAFPAACLLVLTTSSASQVSGSYNNQWTNAWYKDHFTGYKDSPLSIEFLAIGR